MPGNLPDTVSIRPGVSMLSILQHVNYKPWFAMAEFVDNSIQSFLAYRDELQNLEGAQFRACVTIEIDPIDRGRVSIRDNGAGIHELDYTRAFRPAGIPPDTTGLSEFGMGMKSAACWFSRCWTVRTTALGEPLEKTVSFDIDRIIREEVEELQVQTREVRPEDHYTEIVLSELHRPLQGRTIGKIKEHLASIYRVFTREGLLELQFDRDHLQFSDPAILVAPHFRKADGEPVKWRKDLDLDFGLGLRAHGFAALRATGSTTDAGFALFRRRRLIQGSADEGYRPEQIFGKSNSFTYQRLFGELHLEGFEVSHTKDGFKWEDHEEIVLDSLRQELNREPIPLLTQAEGFRTRLRPADVESAAEVVVERTALAIQHEVPRVLEQQLKYDADPREPLESLPVASLASKRTIEVDLQGRKWQLELELSNDPAVGEWIGIYDHPATDSPAGGAGATRRLGIRLSLAHPFMERFGGTTPEQIEPLLRVGAAIILAEISAREGGVRMAGRVRHYVNELLRDALAKP